MNWTKGRFFMSETIATNVRLPEEVLKALGLKKAFAFDRHFEQMEGTSHLP
jgi:hypothetical protein